MLGSSEPVDISGIGVGEGADVDPWSKESEWGDSETEGESGMMNVSPWSESKEMEASVKKKAVEGQDTWNLEMEENILCS